MGTFLTFCCLMWIWGIIFHTFAVVKTEHGSMFGSVWATILIPPYGVLVGIAGTGVIAFAFFLLYCIVGGWKGVFGTKDE